MDFILIFVLICYISEQQVLAENDCPSTIRNSTDYNLQACLLKDYNLRTAPHYRNSNDSEVILWFGLKYLALMNNKIQMFGYLDLNWLDERLAFDSDFYDGEMAVALPRNKVWKPTLVDKSRMDDFIFNTGYALLLSNSERSIDNVLVTNTGHVDLHQVVTLIGKCDADFSFYPFDVHNCSAYISAPDPALQYLTYAYDFEDYRVYYDVVKELKITQHKSSSETILRLNLVFQRHSRMHVIMLHVPVLALLLFNFLALWLSRAHLMKLILPVASFCGALYQIHAINNLMEQSYSQSDVFAVSGSKPLHIILLYRNIISLSLMVILQNFFSSLFGLRRRVLILFLMEYSETYARSCAPKDKLENSEEPKDESEDSAESNVTHPSPFTPHFITPLSTVDYAVTLCDILIVTFIAYNFGYLTFLVLHSASKTDVPFHGDDVTRAVVRECARIAYPFTEGSSDVISMKMEHLRHAEFEAL